MGNSVYFTIMWVVISALVVGIISAARSVSVYRQRIERDQTIQAQCQRQLALLQQMRWVALAFVFAIAIGGLALWNADKEANRQSILETRAQRMPVFNPGKIWVAPDAFLAETDEKAKLIAYGRDLVAHTEDYFGKNGLVRPASINGMNCQNCHLDAGSKPFGNNYFAVQSTYPQIRARSGALETIPKRVNDCFERSLNGQALDTTSREMKAITAYIEWLGSGVPKGAKPKGSGLAEVPFLDRAADPQQGQKIYAEKCASCHATNGEGLPMPGGARNYPPLWGENSYNEAAGLFRMSRFAGYVKANMPFGASYDNPQLSDEEAWDVAAYVNSQPRPKHPFLDSDWPKIEKKPFDHPFGPHSDTFPEFQHKYGPFGPIVAFSKSIKNK